MTSSLVGSEMCIRDSQVRAQSLSPSSWPVACVKNDRGRSGRAAPRCCATVSYTHLTLPTICSV
eukprot:3899637-Prorocentrum_lima.AAC.1